MADITTPNRTNRTDEEIIASGGTQQDDEDDLPEAADADSANMTPAEDMNRRMWMMAKRTKLDGSSESEVLEWMPEDYRGNKPRIRYENPVNEGRTETYAFEMPTNTEDMTNDFVRFLDKYGLSARSAEEIEGFEIDVEHSGDEDDRWTPVIPDPPGPDKREVVKEAVENKSVSAISAAKDSQTARGVVNFAKIALILGMWPLTGVKIAQSKYEEKKNNALDDEVVEPVGLYVLGLVAFGILWVAIAVLDASTLGILFESGTTSSGNFMPVWGGL